MPEKYKEEMSAKCIVLESSLATDPIQVVVSYLLQIKFCFTDLFHKIEDCQFQKIERCRIIKKTAQ